LAKPVRPFLKWAGGKRQLLPTLRQFYPAAFNAYWEPFLGSGAVFFDLQAGGLLDGHRVTLSDNNADLIACYRALRDSTDEVIRELSRLELSHRRLGPQHYYTVRDKLFNPARAAVPARTNGVRFSYSPALAAMFIYLNRTGYNGLFRLNADGGFNVPAGRYARPRILDEMNLRRAAEALGRPGVTIEHHRFDEAIASAAAGDFLYLDPPYAPLSRTARFTNYTANAFHADDQRRLRDTLVSAAHRGSLVVMSNSTAPAITELYARNEDAKTAGLQCHTVPARRAINSKPQSRGCVEEYVITNVNRTG
jgi:DNA adenine methylase